MSRFDPERRAPLLLLVVLVVLLAIMARSVRGEQGDTLLHRSLRTVVSPLVSVTDAGSGGLGSLWHNYVDLRGARRDAAQARRERDQARALALLSEEVLRENRRLRRMLDLRDSRPRPDRVVAARVIGGAGDILSRGILIDRGYRHGVHQGHPVVAVGGVAGGVVGRVVAVSRSQARVQLVTDKSSSIAVTAQDSRIQGMVHGTVDGHCQLDWIDRAEELRVGSLLVTSGLDELYPPGLPVGVVRQRPSPDGTGGGVRVRPLLDLDSLEEVLVLPPKRKEGEPEPGREDETAPRESREGTEGEPGP
jgi:rod shape-determining protein MreC